MDGLGEWLENIIGWGVDVYDTYTTAATEIDLAEIQAAADAEAAANKANWLYLGAGLVGLAVVIAVFRSG